MLNVWLTCLQLASLSKETQNQTYCSSHVERTGNVLQNASLSVMTQNQIWSMHSTDSLWGDEDNVAPLDEDAPQPPETWLMLEFCDRGSLLVWIPFCSCLAGVAISLRSCLAGVAFPFVHALLVWQSLLANALLVWHPLSLMPCWCGISFHSCLAACLDSLP
jgi:hypothetical protein